MTPNAFPHRDGAAKEAFDLFRAGGGGDVDVFHGKLEEAAAHESPREEGFVPRVAELPGDFRGRLNRFLGPFFHVLYYTGIRRGAEAGIRHLGKVS